MVKKVKVIPLENKSAVLSTYKMRLCSTVGNETVKSTSVKLLINIQAYASKLKIQPVKISYFIFHIFCIARFLEDFFFLFFFFFSL